MPNRERRNNGTFAPKSNEIRQVRTIRLTDKAWEDLGKIAELQNMTRGDLLEEFTAGNLFNKLPDLSSENLLQNKKHQEEVEALKEQIENLTQENQLLSKRMFANLELMRDTVLFGLKIGKQAPGYKTAQKALNQFIKQLIKLR